MRIEASVRRASGSSGESARARVMRALHCVGASASKLKGAQESEEDARDAMGDAP